MLSALKGAHGYSHVSKLPKGEKKEEKRRKKKGILEGTKDLRYWGVRGWRYAFNLDTNCVKGKK